MVQGGAAPAEAQTAEAESAKAKAAHAARAAIDALTHEQREVLRSFSLGWSPRARTWVLGWLVEGGRKDSRGRRYTHEVVAQAGRELASAGWLTEPVGRTGTWRVAEAHRSTVYLDMIDRENTAELRALLGQVLRFDEMTTRTYMGFSDLDAASTIVRFELFSGVPLAKVGRLKPFCGYRVEWNDVVQRAVMDDLDAALLARLEPAFRATILRSFLVHRISHWTPAALPVMALAEHHMASNNDESSFALRIEVSLNLLWNGEPEQAVAPLEPLRRGPHSDATWAAYASAVAAAAQALRGEWADAEAGFDAALIALKPLGKRKGLLPDMLAAPYVLSLLAQQTPAHLAKALKYCLAESGKKQPSVDTWWGIVALAVQMRRGDQPLEPKRFAPSSSIQYLVQLDLWRWLMRAWLATDTERQPLSAHELNAAQLLQAHLDRVGLWGLRQQLDASLAVLQGQAAPAHFFVHATHEPWRNALAALASITQAEGSSAAAEGTDRTRLLWVVALDAHGGVTEIAPFEQKRGLRGWNKPKELALAKLVKTDTLPPADAAVARAVRPLPYMTRGHRLDLAAAIVSLIGHPHVEFADAPDVFVDITEGQPELDVVEVGDNLQVRLHPPLHSSVPAPHMAWSLTANDLKEMEALRLITVVRDSPQRARLIRLTPAQRRAAQLIGEKLEVPKAALPQLQQVLQGLGAHFQVHADGLQAARDVQADARLRAELSPEGDGVLLRLVVAPLGLDGPRVAPGHGRARLIASVKGETLGAQRDLALERSHLDSVLDACAMLSPTVGAGHAEWLIERPDDALALVEQLPALSAVAGIDWPKGKAIRVDTATLSQLKVQLRSGREWLALQGGVVVDESLVFGLEQLLQWSSSGQGRFMPMGEGRYLALTQELRSRLDELASVAQLGKAKKGSDKGSPAGSHTGSEWQVSPVAASWLEATLEGATVEADAAFTQRIQRLEAAQALQPLVPASVQASFRPYQEEGYAWAMRLAEAGFGAILADDMGLGKTLQALAVLVSRAAGGPALVVAPTSLGGNWLAEARRFAPTLNVQIFGDSERDGEREAMISGAAAADVIVVSYQLLQINAEAFAKRDWHTLVLDEAQAIKNAAAKRSQAVFEVKAGFRLALSGTPIENRLSELWSIMRVCNPGLLGTLAQFNERFAAPIERDRNRNAQRTLRRLISPFILRRTKAQVLDDLPPRTELTLMVDADDTERAHYEALRRQALSAMETSVASDKPGQAQINILAQLTRLRRAACDPRLVSPHITSSGAKVQAFSQLASELAANGHKALVFSQFVDFLTLLREPLDAAGLRYQYLDGSTPPAERTRRVAAFQAGEGDLFLISLKAGGFGLNLTVADYVVIADPWWNPAAEDQASGRAHRIGQQRPVTVYRLVNRGTLEERIVALHADKRELADSVLEGGEVSGALKAEELVELIRGGGV